MRSCRFESETSRLFQAEGLLERAHIKNVIELSVLHRGSGAASAQEYELTGNASMRTKKARPHLRSRFSYRRQRLIFRVATRWRAPPVTAPL
jgi:hypothetical protein